MLQRFIQAGFTAGLVLLLGGCVLPRPISAPSAAAQPSDVGRAPATPSASASAPTATPIHHLVVIYQENVSFDHYFGTYPHARNPPGEPAFHAAPGTPRDIDNYLTYPRLLTHNPNLAPINGRGAANPFRLDRSQAATADQDHDYTAEQMAFHDGRMDRFPLSVGRATPPPPGHPGHSPFHTDAQTLGYYDGNTVTALWNYAQRYAISDRFFGTTFGPSTPGAINLIAGQTDGIVATNGIAGKPVASDGAGGRILMSDTDPLDDVCSNTSKPNVRFSGRNIGDLLNARGISWGWFEGGFDLGRINANGTTGCRRSTDSMYTGLSRDYIPHHAPFQYYAATANPTHARPASVAAIGHSRDANGKPDPANHQYGLRDFYAAVQAGHFPAVTFIKAPGFEDGHAGYSDPLDEQRFLVELINFIQRQPQWPNTAILVAYDDSDGWYDHRMGPIINPSHGPRDALNGRGVCQQPGTRKTGTPLPGLAGRPVDGRCGSGPRLPLVVISPWAKRNAVDHTTLDQTSITRFIEDNWLHGQRIGQGSFDTLNSLDRGRSHNNLDGLFDFATSIPPNLAPLILDPRTGDPMPHHKHHG
jgi:Phospholipase C